MSSDFLDAVRRARETGDFANLVEAIPYARFSGISVEVSEGELTGRLRYTDELIGNTTIPALHGGVIGALLESTAIYHLLWSIETLAMPKTIDITFEYLRSGRPTDTFAQATVIKHGWRVANVRVEAWQEDRTRPIACAHGQFLLTG